MTLIISFLSDDNLIHVSDRRITYQDYSRTKVLTEGAIKSVFYRSNMVFSYTGLAYIYGTKADIWLVNFMKETMDLNAVEFFSKLEKTLETYIRHMKSKHSKVFQLAFVGIGWRYEEKRFVPAVFQTSNFMDERNRPFKPGFSFRTTMLAKRHSGGVNIVTAGAEIPSLIKNMLTRGLRRCVAANSDPTSMARLIIEAVYKTSERNSTVGKDLLIASIPKSAIEAVSINNKISINFDLPKRNEINFCSVGPSSSNGVGFVPHIVDENGIIQSISYGPLTAFSQPTL